jgi:hypothetical protein
VAVVAAFHGQPARVVWLLAGGVALTTIPSMIAYYTHTLWVCKLMFCIFIPAIYFYIGPCFGLLNNLSPCHMRNMFIAISLLVANILNLIVAPWVVGVLERLVRGSSRHRRGLIAGGVAMSCAHGLLGGVSSVYGIAHHRRGPEAGDRLHQGLVAVRVKAPSMGKTSIDRRWLPLNALRAFEGVAKHSSFTAAANALLISQSALSRHVIALEKLIGAQLFERRPHALVLTKAGQHCCCPPS